MTLALYRSILNAFGFDELYDLQDDPHDITDDIIFNQYPNVALVPYGPQ